MADELSAADFDVLRKMVRERSGIVLGDDKRYLVEHRLVPVAAKNSCKNLSELAAKIKATAWSDLHKQVVEMMTTNETYFFRDIQPFEALVQAVIPSLIKSKGTDRQLHIWCAASSTGQEPYSILMALRDKVPALANWRIKMVATDINTEVLAKARSGIYTAYEVNRGLPPDYLNRFFEVDGIDFIIKEEFRRMVDYRPLNLLEQWNGLQSIDIVFIRNVLIYFDVETKRSILGKVRKIINNDGFMFLGGAETTLNIDDNFERVPFDRAGCYRIRSAAPQAKSGVWNMPKVNPLTVPPKPS